MGDRVRAMAVLLVAILVVGAGSAAPAADHDLVIRGGRVIDPETKLDAVRNVGVTDGRITAVTEAELTGARVIDATGHVVAPGFITRPGRLSLPILLFLRYRHFFISCLVSGTLRSRLLSLEASRRLGNNDVRGFAVVVTIGLLEMSCAPSLIVDPRFEAVVLLLLMSMSNKKCRDRQRIFLRVVAGWPLTLSAASGSDVLLVFFWVPQFLLPRMFEVPDLGERALAVVGPEFVGSAFELMVVLKMRALGMLESTAFWENAPQDLGQALSLAKLLGLW